MIFNALLLFLVAIIPALIPVYSQKISQDKVKMLLTFAGAYLFSITIIHLLPEIFGHKDESHGVSIVLLAGFFFQYILELFSSGIEHGHVHHHGRHHHGSSRIVTLMLALSLHSFLEGTILSHQGEHFHGHHSSNSLLLGVVLHKIPAAIALVSFLTCDIKSKTKCLILAILFAAASPAGLIVGHVVQIDQLLDERLISYLFAFVCGNFLHISTTIFFETSPEHKWNLKKLLITIFAAFVAIGIEKII